MDYNAIAKVYFFLVCLHIYLFRLCIKKDSEKGVTFKIFYLHLQPDTHSAHAELKLPLLERRLKRGLGRERYRDIILKCVYYALSS